jgi:hypothetical protein
VYKFDSSRPTEIFAGATKLSMTDQIEDLLNDLFHWMKCLTEIRRKVDGGEWHVHLDDIDAVWDEELGWKMPEN